jgi:hypothetical protein
MKVQQDNVGLKIARHLHRLREVFCLAYNFEVRSFCQQAPNLFPHSKGIVRQ